MRKGVFSTWGFKEIIVAVLAVLVGVTLIGLHSGWLEAWNLNALFVDPVNDMLPIWVPFSIPPVFP